LVSHCMNRDKPMNMRKSITPKRRDARRHDMLLGCKLELQRQIKMPPVMGYGVLEPYEAKVSRTVPRRGGGSNLSSLFYK
jgi:hypothetical protein